MTTPGPPADLPEHGIIFRTTKHGFTVSCQCRASEMKHSRTKGGGEYYEPIPLRIGDSLWRAYDNPDNHWIPFGEKDKINHD